jgi:hypothetical protein
MPVGTLIGIGAGLASALLFYSAAGGSPLLSTILLLLTPLPTLLAGLGWGWLAAATGGVAGALAVLVFAESNSFAIGFVLALGVPAAGIAYAAYLSRAVPDAPDQREWYPAGRLLAAMSLYAGALPLLIPALTGGSYEELRAPAAEFSRRLSQRAPELGLRPLSEEQAAGLAQAFVASLPAVLAAYWLAVFSLNTYLAGRIARASGRLARDWPDLSALALPAGFTLLIVPALAATWMGGSLAILGTGFTGALLFAHLISGLALMHYIARHWAPWLLWFVYGGLILLGPYTALAITLAGLLDPLLKVRQRFHPQSPS